MGFDSGIGWLKWHGGDGHWRLLCEGAEKPGVVRSPGAPRMMAELGMERNASARSLSLQFGG